jgi:hypothetical protein
VRKRGKGVFISQVCGRMEGGFGRSSVMCLTNSNDAAQGNGLWLERALSLLIGIDVGCIYWST